MVAGQVADLEGEHQAPEPRLLETIHRAKTGALIRASLRIGAIYAGADDTQLEALSRYGEHVGLAFQIVDDILDVEQSSEALGKTAGKDSRRGKPTYVSALGLSRAREFAEELRSEAHVALQGIGAPARRLGELADFIVLRKF